MTQPDLQVKLCLAQKNKRTNKLPRWLSYRRTLTRAPRPAWFPATPHEDPSTQTRTAIGAVSAMEWCALKPSTTRNTKGKPALVAFLSTKEIILQDLQ